MSLPNPEGAPEVVPPVVDVAEPATDVFDLSSLRPPGYGAAGATTAPNLANHSMTLVRDRATGLMHIVSHNVTPNEHAVLAEAVAAAGNHLDAIRDYVPGPDDGQDEGQEHLALTGGVASHEEETEPAEQAVFPNPIEEVDDEPEEPGEDELPPEEDEEHHGIFSKVTAGVGRRARERARNRMTGGRASAQPPEEEAEPEDEDDAATAAPRLNRKGRTKFGKNKPTAVKLGIATVTFVASNLGYHSMTHDWLITPSTPIHRAEDIYHNAQGAYATYKKVKGWMP